jgi:hypothetical protein
VGLPPATGRCQGIQSCPRSRAACSCIGGQRTVPYEQYTQQSPGFGLSTAWQHSHSYDHWQASVGIVSILTWPQSGHLNVVSVIAAFMSSPVILAALGRHRFIAGRETG